MLSQYTRLTTCHLRWGQLPSAGPRQKEGAGWRGVRDLTVAGRVLWSPTFSANYAERLGYPALCLKGKRLWL
jgi:hypothetical protein